MAERDLDACFLGREANARYATGVRRLWTAQSRPFVPACLVVRNPPAVELLSFSASYEDIPDEVGPDHFFPVTWNPMNMMDRFQKTEGVLDARRIGYDSLSPFFEGMLRQTLPEAEFVGVEDMMRALKRVKLPEEITCIRTAAAIAESSLYAAISEVRPGVTEHHLRAAFLDRMCALGTSQFAQQGTFTVIDPGAPFRWTTTDRVLREGDSVALAGGVLWAGYEGSLARTWWCGDELLPGAEQHGTFARWQRGDRRGHRPVPTRAHGCRSPRRVHEGGRLRSADDDGVRGRPRARRAPRGPRHEPGAGAGTDHRGEHGDRGSAFPTRHRE